MSKKKRTIDLKGTAHLCIIEQDENHYIQGYFVDQITKKSFGINGYRTKVKQ
jgi:hypothetical protein